ncbi:WXG100 family type VII secretion target [Paractinoplanes lichenicola]|uniref:WXG100 family type VII secretion target n=1 Tax=Paractinoplanes lichenicola TaxID=2802976 RepID=A0ABS1VW94_9ACTN|nr:WXG100 family type VII secretion target [Actinoplanes lichenicola]MBL7258751.1 WXG100 family type VII secretion target [Actinoplanes lichenicola]
MTSTAEEQGLLDKIMSLLDKIEQKTNDLQHAINSKLKYLPGFLQDKVVSGWNKFCDFMKQAWDGLREIIANMGSPSALATTANAWSNEVGGPVSGRVQYAEAGLLEVDTNWDGDAAEAYRQTLPLQKAALEKMKTALTDGIATALGDMVKGIYVFWGALVVALAALVAGIISAISSSATIVGLPAAPFIAGGAAAVAVAAFAAGGINLKSTAAAANSTLRQKLNDNSGYHDGAWPPAVTG